MKANELMIGDWALLNGTSTKINYLNEDRVGTEDNYLAIFEVEPIPLTEEILKANGIDYESEVGIIKKIGGHIHIRGWMANCELYLGMIRYVHELQHALRLCGLNELADNFKLKEE